MKLLQLLSKVKQLGLLKFFVENKLLTGALLLLVFQQFHYCQEMTRLEKELQKSHATALAAEGAVAIHEQEINILDKKLQKKADKANAAIKELVQFKASIGLKGAPEVKVKTVYEEKEVYIYTDDDKLDLQIGKIYRATGEGLLTPLKSFTFEAEDDLIHFYFLFVPDENPDSYDPLRIETAEYTLHLDVVGQMLKIIDEVNESYHLRLFRVKDGVVKGAIPVSAFSVITKDIRASRFRLWAPKIDLAASLPILPLDSIGSVTEIGFSFSGYGLTPDNLSWRFIRLSAGLTSDSIGVLGFTPVMYNIGKIVPLVDNMFTGPSITFDANREFGVGLTLGVSL